MKTEKYTKCAVDGHHGIYAWQIFAERFPEGWEGCVVDTRETLLVGPTADWYWESAQDAEWGFLVRDNDGNGWTVCQTSSGDILLLREDAPEGLLEEIIH